MTFTEFICAHKTLQWSEAQLYVNLHTLGSRQISFCQNRLLTPGKTRSFTRM